MAQVRTPHPNAKVTSLGRRAMVDVVVVEGWSVAATAERFGVDPKTVRKCRDRPQTNGKVERFHRILLEEWAYIRAQPSKTTSPECTTRGCLTPSTSYFFHGFVDAQHIELGHPDRHEVPPDQPHRHPPPNLWQLSRTRRCPARRRCCPVRSPRRGLAR